MTVLLLSKSLPACALQFSAAIELLLLLAWALVLLWNLAMSEFVIPSFQAGTIWMQRWPQCRS